MKITNEEIKEATLRFEASSRGGGIEISLDSFGFPYGKMTAYQNYLGGGMLGSIGNDCNIEHWPQNHDLTEIAEALARYFHEITRHSDDQWEDADFEQNQNRPLSAY
jgi:hypothetical protein